MEHFNPQDDAEHTTIYSSTQPSHTSTTFSDHPQNGGMSGGSVLAPHAQQHDEEPVLSDRGQYSGVHQGGANGQYEDQESDGHPMPEYDDEQERDAQHMTSDLPKTGLSDNHDPARAGWTDTPSITKAKSEGPHMQTSADAIPGTDVSKEEAPQTTAEFTDTRPKPSIHTKQMLNVSDALTYLERVKASFHDRPSIYTAFLDIMKDFKSQSIDTPCVIKRVSDLFAGYPDLIQGFNTFLPPGYSIDCSDAGAIRVITPTGLTVLPELLTPGFNHAIQYVNKIKVRFADQPDIYKQFLEVLQTYGKDQSTMQMQEVYAQVTQLFASAPDLLHEFHKFLPDDTPVPGNQNGLMSMLNGSLASLDTRIVPSRSPLQPSMQPDMQNPSSQRSSEKFKSARSEDLSKKKKRAAPLGSTVSAKKKLKQLSMNSAVNSPLATSTPATLDDVKTSSGAINALTTPAEMAFFERVKKYLDDKSTYHDFLKLLNLYTQEIIDLPALVRQAERFLGGNEDLFESFYTIVGAPADGPIDLVIGPFRERFDRDKLKSFGQSYRKLPQHEVNIACSGRDALCWSVLNDEWVSHPTFASEDSGFIAHRKNIYEEALHKSEEERYEYDNYIETNLRTISLLEPIAARINMMTPEDKAAFKLKPGLGGPSRTIYQRVVKKVYGSVEGMQVIQALHERPDITVPIVLARLKLKDEEWRRAQREWSKVWRDVEARNFYKSLDHQGINFKLNDKKATAPKALTAEIEALHREQHAQGSNQRWQYNFPMPDSDVLLDVLKLILCQLEANPPPNNLEREKTDAFLTSIFSNFFELDSKTVYRLVRNSEPNDVADKEPRVVEPNSRAEDTRRRLMKFAINSTGAEEPAWIRLVERGLSPTSILPDLKHNNFFANNNFYVILRLIHMLYHRLSTMKNLAKKLSEDWPPSRRINPLAKALGLAGASIPIEPAGVTLGEAENPARFFYDHLLSLTERLLEGDLDIAVYEDCVRWMFEIQGYVMFTVDKLTTSIVRQLSSASQDVRSREILSLLESDREERPIGNKAQILYRKNVEGIMGEDNIYRLEWINFEKNGHMQVQLLCRHDATVEEGDSPLQRWRYYAETYVLDSPTETLTSRGKMPFLKRSLQNADGYLPNRRTRSALEIRLCPNTYRLFFIPKTEDCYERVFTAEELQERTGLLTVRRNERRSKFAQWLEHRSAGLEP